MRDNKGARRAIEALYAHKDHFFAVDTEVGKEGGREGDKTLTGTSLHDLIAILPPSLPLSLPQVADLNLKTEGPVGNGRVICFSVYGGPDVDFGHGKGTVRKGGRKGGREGGVGCGRV